MTRAKHKRASGQLRPHSSAWPTRKRSSRSCRATVLDLWESSTTSRGCGRRSASATASTIFGSARAQAGNVRLRRGQARGRGVRRDGLRHRHRRRPGPDAGGQRRAPSVAGAPSRSVGIRVDLPFEQEVNPFVEQAFEHKTFFTRLHHFVLASDAFVVVPGGIGTVLETLMIWQLLQVRHVHDVAADPGGQDVGGAGRLGQGEHAATRSCRWPAPRTWTSRAASTRRMRRSPSSAICIAKWQAKQ